MWLKSCAASRGLAIIVEIGVSDGTTQIFRPGDARLMEDTSGRGHTHRDLSPVIQAAVVLKD
jgi:hypothetical protein